MKVMALERGDTGWDTYVQARGDATSYHRFGWREVFTRSFRHPCHYLAVTDDRGSWQGVLPLTHMRSRIFGNFLVSLPFVNYGGLLCDNEEAAAVLLTEAETLRRSCGATHVELRHVASRTGGLATKQHKVTMILELAGTCDAQWKAFDPKLRNQIRKAEKSGLHFRRGGLERLDGFYDVFTRNMRDLGTPVYAKRFFQNVLEMFPDTTAVFEVMHDAKSIAAGIGYWFKGRLEVPWASSIKDYKSFCPNHMLYWEAIRFAIDNGFREFDFGRSTPGEGTYHFKKQWGALPVPLHWQYLMDKGGRVPELNPGNPKYRLAIRAWQRLPLPVANLLGPSIVRNIP